MVSVGVGDGVLGGVSVGDVVGDVVGNGVGDGKRFAGVQDTRSVVIRVASVIILSNFKKLFIVYSP